jgi:zinc/manganese transport system substrate-binding protein
MLGTILIIGKRSGMALLALLVMVGLLAGCSPEAESTPSTEPTSITQADSGSALKVVATTSIAADLVSLVVGERASIETLMPIGVDPHDFQPTPQQVARIRQADLIVAWGLGLEEGLEDVLESAAGDGVRVLEVSPGVDPIEFGSDHDDGDHADQDDDDHGHDQGLDPHTWMDPVRMADAVRLIAAELAAIDPEGDWVAAADRAAASLTATHAEVESILAPIPADRRKLITNHETFNYFAERYGFEVIGVAIPGGSTLASPSSAVLAQLVATIREAGVTVLFGETSNPTGLLDAIAGEVEGVSVVELLTESLAEPGQPGDTYTGMLLYNARAMAEALGG